MKIKKAGAMKLKEKPVETPAAETKETVEEKKEEIKD